MDIAGKVFPRYGEKKRTPKGHFVVYVGSEMKRFVVPMSHLKNATFQQLLKESAEVYGFQNQKGIVLPCCESTFQRVLVSIHSHPTHQH